MEGIAGAKTMAEEIKKIQSDTIKSQGKGLFGFIRSKVSSNEDAEDLLQEVWYRFAQLTNLDELESISGWLFQVARSRITDFYRKKKNSSLDDLAYESEEGELNFKDILLADDSHKPEMKQFKELFWNELIKALNELPANQREAFVLNEIEELSLQEIADRSGENLKTIISRKGYAVKFLRSRLTNLYQEFINT